LARIAQVIDYGGATGGSFIPALGTLARAAAPRGHTLSVVATDVPGATWPADLRAAGVDLHLAGGPADVARALRALRPDIVHAHFTRYDLPSLSAAGAAQVYWHVHSHREDSSSAARARAWLKYRVLGRRVTALVAVSREIAREIVDWSGPAERVRVVANGIDVERFRPPSAAERSAARAALGVEPGEPVVLFFERVAYKGGAILREALDLLPGVRVVVAGGTAAARAAFAILPGAILLERVADTRLLYWAADALAFASDREAFGYVLVEALACGVPIAASDIPIVDEICDAVPSVVRFPVGDAPALARALRVALGMEATGAGRARVVEHFNVTGWAEAMLRLYEG
jgi:UDP-glucose:(heptosyl)LPS alpha-1,3-glucosyltransferase